MNRIMGLLLAVALVALPLTADAQDKKAERRARKAQRKIENAIRDSLRKVASDNELIDLGYGHVKKKDLAMSVSKVNVNERAAGSFSDMGAFLAGKVPGLIVRKTGEGTYKYIIRSSKTIYGDTDPLFVVDGVAVDDISNLDPYEVDHVEVLKDAASASIYGTRGGNGVILITTKRK